MRILLLVDSYLPTRKSQAKLIHELGVELVRQGHEATVVSPSETVRAPFELRTEEGVHVLRVRGPRLKGAGKVVRAIQEERLSSVIWRGARAFFEENRFDLIVYYSPTIFFGRLVRRLKRLSRCPTYLILRDIFPQWAVDAGLLRKGLVWRFFRHRELQQYAVADVIAVQSPRNLDYFREELPGRRYRLEVLFNWASLDEGDLAPSDLRARLDLKDDVIFLYGGNIGVAQDMDNLVRLAKSFPRDLSATFLLVGEGSEVGRLEARIADERVGNLRVLPAVDQREYAAMLRDVDVGLISLDRRLGTHNFPGKMLGYMHAALPILASLNPGNDLASIIDEGAAGLWALNGRDEELLAHAVSLARDPELRRQLGANGRKLLEDRFSVSAAARQIVAHAVESRR